MASAKFQPMLHHDCMPLIRTPPELTRSWNEMVGAWSQTVVHEGLRKIVHDEAILRLVTAPQSYIQCYGFITGA
eukprot:3549016-Karenia_brevis.AAC.1